MPKKDVLRSRELRRRTAVSQHHLSDLRARSRMGWRRGLLGLALLVLRTWIYWLMRVFCEYVECCGYQSSGAVSDVLKNDEAMVSSTLDCGF